MACAEESTKCRILKKVILKLLDARWDATPPHLAQIAHSIVRQELGVDPYQQVKKESNDAVLRMYEKLKSLINSSQDPLSTAARIAVAGNIMDFGPSSSFDFKATVDECLTDDFAIDNINELKEKLATSSSILYISDNAGEIVCDKLLIETILDNYNIKSVVFVIKGGPILNDTTETDALYVGLDKIREVSFLCVSNGDPNTGISRDSAEFKNVLNNFDIVISKGQGNYEMLSDNKDIFFLLKVKCPLIARDSCTPLGSMICGINSGI